MKLSEVDLAYIKDFCGVADDDYDSDILLESNLSAAKSFILNTTGLSMQESDKYEDLTVALQTMVYEAFYYRRYLTEAGFSNGINPLAEQIIEQHRRNFL